MTTENPSEVPPQDRQDPGAAPAQAAAQAAEPSSAPPATFSERLLAFLLDAIAVILLVGTAGLWVGPMEPGSTAEVVLGVSVYVVFFLYHGILNAAPGQTPGKWVAGIRAVTMKEGLSPGLPKSLLRSFGYFLSLPPLALGFLWSLFNADKRSWHDYMAGTRVVAARQKGPVARWSVTAGAWLLLLVMAAGAAYRVAALNALADAEMISVARETLSILAELEERHKSLTGQYSDSLAEIAQHAEVPSDLHQALPKILLENSLQIDLTPGGYRIAANARDSGRTPVWIAGGSASAEGPPKGGQ